MSFVRTLRPAPALRIFSSRGAANCGSRTTPRASSSSRVCMRHYAIYGPGKCAYRPRLWSTTRPLRATIATSSKTKLVEPESGRPSLSSSSIPTPSSSASPRSSSASLFPSSSILLPSSQNIAPSASSASSQTSTSNPTSKLHHTHIEAHECQVLHAPSQTDIDDLELDVDLLPPTEARLFLSDSATQQLRRVSARTGNPDAALRISVESGGCHGYQYKLKLIPNSTDRQPDDYVFAHPTVRSTSVLIDAVSLPLMNGSMLDYVRELIGSSFRVSDNPQARGSGCGCGVSWELKL